MTDILLHPPTVEPLRYDTVPIGETVGPIAYTIPADHNRQRLGSYSLPESAFLPGTGFAEPSLLCGQHSWVMRRRFSWDGSVHAKCDIALFKPVALGARIHVSCRLSGKYERRGGRYVVFTLETHDDSGDLVCSVDNSMLLNFREVIEARRKPGGDPAAAAARTAAGAAASAAAGATAATGAGAAPGARADAAAGAAAAATAAATDTDAAPTLRLSFGPKTLRRHDILTFFAAEEAVYGPHASLHNRRDLAQAAGLPDIIAPGRYSIGLMNCLFARLYGEQWLSQARYAVTFLQNLLPNVRLQAQASASSDAGAHGFDIVSMDQVANRPVLSGTASLAAR